MSYSLYWDNIGRENDLLEMFFSLRPIPLDDVPVEKKNRKIHIQIKM